MLWMKNRCHFNEIQTNEDLRVCSSILDTHFVQCSYGMHKAEIATNDLMVAIVVQIAVYNCKWPTVTFQKAF